ncbi:uncharacterized protein LACBIDRAFT_298682 [Laccaria bicolor S238N-H82]|uniref:Predicted protein n=1 Tax=Laccaria bicolor (strain S238N-H82 / ATCC MYA-4686) TaxID=486041 RepID=B0DDE5_LACBS|nr:uncharacterized protein LACBIDRAFT_298682 [Laccaria bicolor S238N-H82]EDR07462.1 predicted protein [Laccaria bicolor S238N-H82]|eukprot:XP_001881854.1 predicted protein [Laccaria bicolor S238N-H82]
MKLISDISRIVPDVSVGAPILIVCGFTGAEANSLEQSGCSGSSDCLRHQRLIVMKFNVADRFSDQVIARAAYALGSLSFLSLLQTIPPTTDNFDELAHRPTVIVGVRNIQLVADYQLLFRCHCLQVQYPLLAPSSSLLLTRLFDLIPCEFSSRQTLLPQNGSVSFLDK